MSPTPSVSLPQLQSACEALGIVPPAELANCGDAAQRAALAAQVRAVADAITASVLDDDPVEVRDAIARAPGLRSEGTDHTAAVRNLLDRIDPHLEALTGDFSAPGAVALTWVATADRAVPVEGFALAATRLLYAIGDIMRYRSEPDDHFDDEDANRAVERIHHGLDLLGTSLNRRQAAYLGVDLDEAP